MALRGGKKARAANSNRLNDNLHHGPASDAPCSTHGAIIISVKVMMVTAAVETLRSTVPDLFPSMADDNLREVCIGRLAALRASVAMITVSSCGAARSGHLLPDLSGDNRRFSYSECVLYPAIRSARRC